MKIYYEICNFSSRRRPEEVPKEKQARENRKASINTLNKERETTSHVRKMGAMSRAAAYEKSGKSAEILKNCAKVCKIP